VEEVGDGLNIGQKPVGPRQWERVVHGGDTAVEAEAEAKVEVEVEAEEGVEQRRRGFMGSSRGNATTTAGLTFVAKEEHAVKCTEDGGELLGRVRLVELATWSFSISMYYVDIPTRVVPAITCYS